MVESNFTQSNQLNDSAFEHFIQDCEREVSVEITVTKLDTEALETHSVLYDPSVVKVAEKIYRKVDKSNLGYFNRTMLRAYVDEVMGVVSPNHVFNSEHFERGFRYLDEDGDGKVTLDDMTRFTALNSTPNPLFPEPPPAFLAYCRR